MLSYEIMKKIYVIKDTVYKKEKYELLHDQFIRLH